MEIALYFLFATGSLLQTPAFRDAWHPPETVVLHVRPVDSRRHYRPQNVLVSDLWHAHPASRNSPAPEPADLRLIWPSSPRACQIVARDGGEPMVFIEGSRPGATDTPFAAVEVRFEGRDSREVLPGSPLSCALTAEIPFDFEASARLTPDDIHAVTAFRPSSQWRDAVRWGLWRNADYLVIAPADWIGELAPLIAHRKRLGHRVAAIAAETIYATHSSMQPSSEAILTFIRDLSAHSGKLRYVFLVGDVESQGGVAFGTPIPAGFRPKLDYWTGELDSINPLPTDDIYTNPAPAVKLAVGRYPAHSRQDVGAFVQKLVDYESASADGAWRRRVTVFTGPARYGVVADALIETTAQQVLDNVLPYDYDLTFTFGFPQHAYAVAPHALGDKLVSDLNGGALIAAYVGHGLGSTFDHIHFRDNSYAIGSVEDMERLDVPAGNPFFVSLTCLTGQYDGDGDSLAEAFIRNPRGGIGVFAASRTIHPYANGLMAQAFAQAFLIDRPETVGDGLLTVKKLAPGYRQVLLELAYGFDVAALLDEHAGLYNLFGDPATRLRYAARATVTLDSDTRTPGQPVAVTVSSADFKTGRATITLETQRSTIRGKLTPWSELKDLPLDELRAAMAKNYAIAMDKVVATGVVEMAEGRAITTLTAPAAPGRYAVKVHIAGHGEAAVGHARFTVAGPKR